MLRAFCLACADSTPAREAAAGTGRTRVAMRACLVTAGIFLMMVGALGDHLGIHGTPGFGWHQQLGVLLGALLLVCGGLLRIDLVAVIGAMIVALSAGADWLGLGNNDGFGWKQEGAVLSGFMLALVGLALERWERYASRARGGDCKR